LAAKHSLKITLTIAEWMCQFMSSPSCPYSPECVEGKFSEVRIHDPA
jgi:hypothetical protein